jgi:hypothetical protein
MRGGIGVEFRLSLAPNESPELVMGVKWERVKWE